MQNVSPRQRIFGASMRYIASVKKERQTTTIAQTFFVFRPISDLPSPFARF
jgi:hypothetical protein